MIHEANKIYFIGIGGIGVSAIARLCLAKNKKAAGSDIRDSQTITELKAIGATVVIGHSAENVEKINPDLVIYSQDISPESLGFVELKKAQDLGIATMTYAKALGEMMSGNFGISVTGTNGKSTTTAMLGFILEKAGLDPSVVVGSKLSSKNSSDKFKANARLGHGKYFVAEADEYHRHMMDQKPLMIVLTNVDADHLDYYKDLNDVKSAFEDFIQVLPPDGVVIYNADNQPAVAVGRQAHCHKLTFGIHHYADLQAINPKSEPGKQTFDFHFRDENLGQIEIQLPGLFNISNALGAALAAISLGVKFEVIQKALKEFTGIWRRFEKVSNIEQAEVISDYAHHPAGVAGTIAAAKQFYPNQKILFVFQPHHRNRTKKLLGEFIEALEGADDLIVVEIFDVAGREHGEQVSSKEIVDELKKIKMNVEFAPDLEETEKLIRAKAKDFGAIVMMGAGDIDLLARKLHS